jgi:hypothetical protein
VPQVRLNIDRDRAKQLGVKVDDIYSTLAEHLGAYYVNDFNFGRPRVSCADAVRRALPCPCRGFASCLSCAVSKGARFRLTLWAESQIVIPGPMLWNTSMAFLRRVCIGGTGARP